MYPVMYSPFNQCHNKSTRHYQSKTLNKTIISNSAYQNHFKRVNNKFGNTKPQNAGSLRQFLCPKSILTSVKFVKKTIMAAYSRARLQNCVENVQFIYKRLFVLRNCVLTVFFYSCSGCIFRCSLNDVVMAKCYC